MTAAEEFSSPRVIVTAAASGIGLAIAQKYLENGAQVYVCDIDPNRLEEALCENPGLQGCLVDVASITEVEAFFAKALAAMEGVDFLVNNAGVGGPRVSTEDLDYSDWDSCIRVNLSSMFYCVKQVIPTMKAQRNGCIINIASDSVQTSPTRRLPYVASKAGVVGLSRNLARELGPFNIRCNTILPGLIDNPRGRNIVSRIAIEQEKTTKETEADLLRFSSLRCWIQLSEIADMVYFLTSNAAKHITAQEIAVNGNFEWEE